MPESVLLPGVQAHNAKRSGQSGIELYGAGWHDAGMGEDTKEVNFRVAGRDLKYYIFDWDDNILHMPTRIYLERRTPAGEWAPYPVSTALFSLIRNETRQYRPEGNDWERACRDCRDIEVGDENIFLKQTRAAIEQILDGSQPPAPSFLRFKQTLVEGRIFAVVTARGHAPDVLRHGVEFFVDRVLSDGEKQQMLANLRGYLSAFDPDHPATTDREVLDYYLTLNRYHAVRSSHFKALMATQGTDSDRTEDGKRVAIRDFVHYIQRMKEEQQIEGPVSVGFSDDDPANAHAVEAFIRSELGPEFPGIKFVVYYTANPTSPESRKVEVQGQMNLPFPTPP